MNPVDAFLGIPMEVDHTKTFEDYDYFLNLHKQLSTFLSRCAIECSSEYNSPELEELYNRYRENFTIAEDWLMKMKKDNEFNLEILDATAKFFEGVKSCRPLINEKERVSQLAKFYSDINNLNTESKIKLMALWNSN